MGEKKGGARVVIIGAGMVGATIAYALMIRGLASEIVLIDRKMERARGEAKDLSHGQPFVTPARIWAGDCDDCRDADVIVITAGVGQKPGQTRLDLARKNVNIMRSIVDDILRAKARHAILIVVANPVDVLSYAAWKFSGWPVERVIGSGTVLDTARFRQLLAAHCSIDPRNVHAYIIGEHGDSEVPVWSLANIAGARLDDFCVLCGRGCSPEAKTAIFERVKAAAYRIIDAKGATYYAIGLGTVRIIEAILLDQHSILSVSTLIQDRFGIDDVYLSLLCVITRAGVTRVLDLPLGEEEIAALQRSAAMIKEAIASVGLQESNDA